MKSGLESTPDSIDTKLHCGWLHQTRYMPETQTSATRPTGPMTLSPSPGPLGRPLRQATAWPSTFRGSGPQGLRGFKGSGTYRPGELLLLLAAACCGKEVRGPGCSDLNSCAGARATLTSNSCLPHCLLRMSDLQASPFHQSPSVTITTSQHPRKHPCTKRVDNKSAFFEAYGFRV